MKNPIGVLRRKLRRRLFGDPRAKRIYQGNHDAFVRAGVDPIAFRVLPSKEQQTATDVILRKEKGGLIALVRTDCSWKYVSKTLPKIAPCVYWFHQTDEDIREIIFNASDGDHPSIADFRYSGTSEKQVLLPDTHFFRDRGYANTDAFAANNPIDWNARSDDIIWRGGANGLGHWTVDEATVTLPGVMQRLHMAHKCTSLDIDFRFVTKPGRHDYHPLKRAGFIGDYVPSHDWGAKKYAIDIDGYTNAWSNFMQRLKLGCCVLKVDSPFKYRQWYYDRIQPWEHFVPIKSDLSDLQQQVDWVRTNPEKAREIASNGQSFARALTLESENSYAIKAIEKHALST